MQIKINGQNIDVTIENEKTVGDVLTSFGSEIEKNDASTVGITLDGEKISAQQFDSILDVPLTDNTVLDFDVISKVEVEASFKEVAKEFLELATKLCDVPVFLQSGKDKEASEIINSLAVQFDTFCHTASLSALFPQLYNQMLIDGKDLNEFFKDFSPILTDFENAMEVKDTVTIGDLSEYEIGPRLKSIAETISKLN